MTNKLTAIVLNMSGYKYPRAYFVRYRDGVRLSREYKLCKRHWLMLYEAHATFLPCHDIGWASWVRGVS